MQSLSHNRNYKPFNANTNKNVLVNIDSFIGRGFSFITFLLCGSNPKAITGRLSVNKLINNKCTEEQKGTGNTIIEAYNTAKIPKFPDNKIGLSLICA